MEIPAKNHNSVAVRDLCQESLNQQTRPSAYGGVCRPNFIVNVSCPVAWRYVSSAPLMPRPAE